MSRASTRIKIAEQSFSRRQIIYEHSLLEKSFSVGLYEHSLQEKPFSVGLYEHSLPEESFSVGLYEQTDQTNHSALDFMSIPY
jgi:hypothetical protein